MLVKWSPVVHRMCFLTMPMPVIRFILRCRICRIVWQCGHIHLLTSCSQLGLATQMANLYSIIFKYTYIYLYMYILGCSEIDMNQM